MELGSNGLPMRVVRECIGPGGLINMTGKSMTSAIYATLKPENKTIILVSPKGEKTG